MKLSWQKSTYWRNFEPALSFFFPFFIVQYNHHVRINFYYYYSHADDPGETVVEKTSEFKFLEAEVHVDRHEIYLNHFNKNRNALREEGKQKYFRYHQADSFIPPTQRVGTILETLIRMARYSSKKTDLIRSVKLALEEFLSLHYPKHILARALTKLVRKDPGQWACVKNTIQL